MGGLAGTSAIIAGGASGIGAAVARGLSKQGAHGVIGDLQVDSGQRIAAELAGTSIRCDVTDADDVATLIETARARGPLRRAVASAGVGHTESTLSPDGAGHRVHDMSTFDRLFRINVLGTFDVVRRSAAAMADLPVQSTGERGSVLTLASVEAFDGQAVQVAYAATKAALTGMTLPLARDLAPYGIRVNTLAPGFIDTTIYGTNERARAYKDRLGNDVLFPRRMGRTDEVADLALACLDNTYLNAETIRLDGGLRMPPSLPQR